MNSLLVAVAPKWEERLCELLARRGHIFTVINDLREIDTTLEQREYSLAFVGVGEAVEEAIEICRRLRTVSRTKSLQILACGDRFPPDKVQTFLLAGIGDCLTDWENNAELELRLTLAEFRASMLHDSTVIGRSEAESGDNEIS